MSLGRFLAETISLSHSLQEGQLLDSYNSRGDEAAASQHTSQIQLFCLSKGNKSTTFCFNWPVEEQTATCYLYVTNSKLNTRKKTINSSELMIHHCLRWCLFPIVACLMSLLQTYWIHFPKLQAAPATVTGHTLKGSFITGMFG